MNCHDAVDLMSVVLDNEASQLERVRMDEHLTACSNCRVTWADLREMHDAMPQLLLPRQASLERLPANFAERLSEQVLARHRVHWSTRLRGWWRPQDSFTWARAALCSATFATVTLAAGALSVGTRLHQDGAVNWASSFSDAAWHEMTACMQWLPACARLDGTMIGALVASMILLILGALALRLPGLYREVRGNPSVPLTRSIGFTLGMLTLCAAVCLPLFTLSGLDGPWSLIDRTSQLPFDVAKVWLIAVVFLSGLLFTLKSTRGLTASLCTFSLFVLLGGAIEYVTGFKLQATAAPALPTSLLVPHLARFMEGVGALATTVLTPFQFVGWTLSTCAVLGGATGLALYACGRLSLSRTAGAALLGALAVVAGWASLVWTDVFVAHGFTFEPVARDVAAAPDLPRTVLFLGLREPSRALVSVPYPVPGELRAVLKSPRFHALASAPYGWASPWAYTVRMTAPMLDWNPTRALPIVGEAVRHTPGVDVLAGLTLWSVQFCQSPLSAITRAYRPIGFALQVTPADYTAVRELLRGRTLPTIEEADPGGLSVDPALTARRNQRSLCATKGGKPAVRGWNMPTHRVMGQLIKDKRALVNVPVRLLSAAGVRALDENSGLVVDALKRQLQGEVDRARQRARLEIDGACRNGAYAPMWVGRTDEQGRFTIENVPDGVYAVAVLLDGDPGPQDLFRDGGSKVTINVNTPSIYPRRLTRAVYDFAKAGPAFVEVKGHDLDLTYYWLTSLKP